MSIQLRNTIDKILDILKDDLNLNKTEALGIIVPLKNEEKAKKMLEYLCLNKHDATLMRIDNLIGTTLEIAKS